MDIDPCAGQDTANTGKEVKLIDLKGKTDELFPEESKTRWRIDPKAAVMDMLKKAEREEKKRNREIWRKGLLDRVSQEKVLVEHWGTINSGNFKIMIGECAPHAVRVAVVKDLGSHEVDEWLYKELMKFYDKR